MESTLTVNTSLWPPYLTTEEIIEIVMLHEEIISNGGRQWFKMLQLQHQSPQHTWPQWMTGFVAATTTFVNISIS